MTHFSPNEDRISLDMLPGDIARISEYLRETQESRSLKLQIGGYAENYSIDYESCAPAFNQAFFLRNYLKCIFYLRSLPPNILASVTSIVDLGGGAGPFSLAARHINPQINTLVVDKSRAQLSQANRLSVTHGLGHISNTAHTDMVHLRIEPNITRVLSYSVCENFHRLAFDPALRSTVFGNRCIIVDYPRIVSETAFIASNFGGESRHMVSARHTVCSKLTRLLGQSNITYGGVCIDFACSQ